MGARYLKMEDEVILADFPTASRKEILEKIPNRTWTQISAHARRKGIHRTTAAKGNSIREGRRKLRSAYSDAENDKFRRLYPIASHVVLLAAFPNRTMSALHAHAYVLKVKRTRDAKEKQVKIGREKAKEEEKCIERS